MLSLITSTTYIVVPAILIWLAISRPSFRPKVVSILGAIAPYSVIFLYVGIDYVLNQRTGEAAVGFLAMSILASGAYVVSLVTGVGLAFINWPRNVTQRFVFSVVFVVVLYFAYIFFVA